MSSIEDMILTEVRRRSAAWAAIRDKAEQGLAFSQQQYKYTKDFPQGVYWEGKIHAYQNILELL